VLLVLLIGSVDVSLALYDKAVITNASREGARAGIVARNPKLSEDDIRQVVRTYTDGALIHFGPSKPPPTVSVVQSTMGVDANTLDVTVSYTFEGIGLGTLFQALGRPWVLTSNTVMVHE
jgi:Flp pilus assembly protein TadG